ncbi:MAG: DNA-formamidopyrimidine glycosylase family protein [Pseudolysinimonas sp.]
MPELPEVQALVTDLSRRLIGREIARLDIVAFAALKTYDPPVSALEGLTISGIVRHGKFLDISASQNGASDLHIVVHLARAGWLRWRNNAPLATVRRGAGPLAARLVLAHDGSGFDLTEAGTKKSLAIWIVRDPAEVPRLGMLGPDPMADDFTEAKLADILAAAGRSQIKGVLRDQRQIGGIGNAYSDEILHVAKMSPFKPASMAPDDIHELYVAIRSTLTEAVERSDGLAASELKGEKKSNLRVHARNGLLCPVCGDTIRQVIYSDSTFQYCPTCQTGGKPLADRVLSRLLK